MNIAQLLIDWQIYGNDIEFVYPDKLAEILIFKQIFGLS
jgi:hypothetical protein